MKGKESGKKSKKEDRRNVAHPIKHNFRRRLSRVQRRRCFLDLFSSVNKGITILAVLATCYWSAWQWSVKVDIVKGGGDVGANGIAKTSSRDMYWTNAAI